jgi:hypothetical protein
VSSSNANGGSGLQPQPTLSAIAGAAGQGPVAPAPSGQQSSQLNQMAMLLPAAFLAPTEGSTGGAQGAAGPAVQQTPVVGAPQSSAASIPTVLASTANGGGNGSAATTDSGSAGAAVQSVAASQAEAAQPAVSAAQATALRQAYGQVPLSFEPNQGQVGNASVQYLARGQGYGLFLQATGATLLLSPPSGSSNSSGAMLGMQLVGSNPNAQAQGSNLLSGTSNYFVGSDPSGWVTNVPNYGQVNCSNVYPGIDLSWYGNNQHQVENTFTVQRR